MDKKTTSRDGTPLAYSVSGRGPVVILVSGAMSTGGTLAPLAERLADRLTAVVYDRRGRGRSGDTAPYAVDREVEDLAALLDAVGGDAGLFGVSSGGALALEAALLLLAIPLFKQQQIWGALLAAMACGLQNAMVTTYSGAAVRTTHLSGMFTDLGIGLGHLLRGLPLPMRRLTLSGLIITGFLAGGVIGAWLFSRLKYDALLAPAILTGATGIGHVLYRQWTGAKRDPPT